MGIEDQNQSVINLLFKNEYDQYHKLINLFGESAINNDSKLNDEQEKVLVEPLKLIQNVQQFDKEQKLILEDVYEKFNNDQMFNIIEKLLIERKNLLQLVESLNDERNQLRSKNKEIVKQFIKQQHNEKEKEDYFVNFQKRIHDVNYEVLQRYCRIKEDQNQKVQQIQSEAQYYKDKLDKVEGKMNKERQYFKNFMINQNLQDDRSISNIGVDEQQQKGFLMKRIDMTSRNGEQTSGDNSVIINTSNNNGKKQKTTIINTPNPKTIYRTNTRINHTDVKMKTEQRLKQSTHTTLKQSQTYRKQMNEMNRTQINEQNITTDYSNKNLNKTYVENGNSQLTSRTGKKTMTRIPTTTNLVGNDNKLSSKPSQRNTISGLSTNRLSTRTQTNIDIKKK